MSTTKQVVNYHINRLKNKNRDVRLAAVEELKQIGDVAALEPLQEVFQTDQDAEVRRAAQAAGRAIYLQNRDSTA